MQAAQLLVQVDQAGGDTRKAAVAGEGLRGHLHSALQGVCEVLEAGGGGACLSQGVELLLGLLDLLAGFGLGILDGGLGHLAADAQHFAPERQVVDDAGVVGGVGGRRRAVHQVGEVAQTPQVLERRVAPEPLHQHDRLGQLAFTDVFLHCRKEALVERLEEVTALQPVAQPLVGRVVEQHGPQQGLFSFEVVGRGGDGLAGRRARQSESGYVHRRGYTPRYVRRGRTGGRIRGLSPFICVL